jgi:Glycosyl hydrolase catalytic core
VARDTLGRDAVPVTTNLTGWPLNDEREQEWYLVLDAIGDSLDVISIDLYPADNETEIGRLPERMERVRQRYGRPIFVAEIGLQTTPGSWTEPDQQRYLTAAIEQLRAVELWGICLYELRDNQSPAGFGITRADSTKKLGFHDVIHALSPR